MASRPFFKLSIVDLEKLFEENKNDATFRQQLHGELAHRTTQRAFRLKNRLRIIENSLQENRATPQDKTPDRQYEQSGEKSMEENSAIHQNPSAKQEVPCSMNSSASLPKTPVRFDEIIPMKLEEFMATDVEDHSVHPENILNAWTAMEVLSPATFRKPEDLVDKPYNVVRFDDGTMPWETDTKRFRKGYRLYYQIILGSILMEPAIEALLNVYSDSRAQRPSISGEAVLASVMVDENGIIAGQNPTVLSSFGWGVPVALKGDLRYLEQWTQAEKGLVENLLTELSAYDADGNPLPLKYDAIKTAYSNLIGRLGLDPSLVKQPSFALCTYQYRKLPDAPDPILLNSFFLKDLAWGKALAREKKLPELFKRYIGSIKPGSRVDILQNHSAVRSILAPEKFPPVSWPGKGRYPLAPLQQCAVNIAASELKEGSILAVNGPPGTGKTTLLRDVIANIITERAKILISYDNPEKAFTHTGHKLKRNSAFLHMYSIDEKLRGFEIVVASSNNKAVENISIELPDSGAVAEDSFRNGYFSTVASNFYEREAWGMLSAPLGNASNRSRFRQNFWWDKNYGMQNYLRQASGSAVTVTDDEGLPYIPPVIQKENPPQDSHDALSRWQKVKKDFMATLKKVENKTAKLQMAHDMYTAICRNYETLKSTQQKLFEVESALSSGGSSYIIAQEALQSKQEALDGFLPEHHALLLGKPGFFRRLFFRGIFLAWREKYENSRTVLSDLQKAVTQAKQEFTLLEDKREYLEKQKNELQHSIRSLSETNERLTKEYATFASHHEARCLDAAFFSQSHDKRQTTAPWLDKEMIRLRGELFEHAMAVHKAFVDCAAKPIRHNCSIFLENFGTKSLGSTERDSFIKDLWTTFFLVVPVVSSTFASVATMFSGMGKEEIGWLLIDEAGQALPQAAVGALLRSKRAVVVGDTLQIEPIVVLPESLTEQICMNFAIDSNTYNAPGCSVQTLADRATAYMASYETPYGTREVGVPLLVHRRCADPMFSISNSIAYENLMVQAKQAKPSSFIDTIGNSRWLHVAGNANGKWSPQEGELVLQLLAKIRAGNCTPDFYLITPFVDVQNGLRTLLVRSEILKGWVENPRNWVYEHVGTVHTVQGREAEAVFFVLGAPEDFQQGARTWAGKSPNILNVAVTRAKEAVYVIGNKNCWKNAGVFKTLSQFLP